MAVEVIMPKVDMVMETGTFVEWLKTEGSFVEKGEPLFVISTDKAAMEIEAPASGFLTSLQAKPLDEIPVSNVIAYLAETAPLPALEKQSVPGSNGVAESNLRSETEPPNSSTAVVSLGSELAYERKVRATPVARRLAAELGLNLADIPGRGPKGRIHKADVCFAAERTPIKETASLTPPNPLPTHLEAAQSRSGGVVPLPNARRRQVLPLTGPRRIIAQRMQHSASTAPHISLSLTVDMTEARIWRARASGPIAAETGSRVSYTALIARVVTHALLRHPFLNASLADDQIILWDDIHLGIATYVDEVLIVPVIRDAQTKNLAQMTKDLNDLLSRARAKKLLPGEMGGSTFTISNLGMFGIENFTSIINPPEAAILSVGKIEERQIMAEAGPSFRPVMTLTLNADHRIVDGVAAARFLADCKGIFENPYQLI